jgi:hypothetical protein
MRKLLILSFFLPLMAWAQSTLPPCPENGLRKNCFGRVDFNDGSAYVGGINDDYRFEGEGVLYKADGSVSGSGVWVDGRLVTRYGLNSNRFTSGKPSKESSSQSITNPQWMSSLPPCPATGRRHNCSGSVNYLNQSYVGEFRLDHRHGFGVSTFVSGERYVGRFTHDFRNGEGIEFSADGSVARSGLWENNNLVQSYALDTTRFPINTTQVAAISPVDTAKSERDRLAAEVGAERKKRQDLEQRLAEAEAKERERQQSQVPQPQRPQVALRNERRLALVIGNSSYKVSPLDNPANDANDVAESLKKFGFQTTLVRNATLGQMREATRKFADQLPSADVALIYFAGHGIESNRKNYMIPVNADLKFEYELADQGYDAGIWLEMLESIKSNNADRVNIVILDACRNNSLIGSRNLGRGLGKMDAPSGTFLAYSTAPGKVAADGGRGERNSPFTKHLIRAMQQPNQPIEEVFKEVRRNVGKETNGAQVPWESTSLTGFFTFRQGR